MRKFNILLVLAILLLYACTKENQVGKAKLSLCIEQNSYTKAQDKSAIIDTSEFLLQISGAGNIIYDNSYGRFPKELELEAGKYTVSIRSSKTERAMFSNPEYGDTQTIVLKDKSLIRLKLSCRLINAAIKLNIDKSFLRDYPDGLISLESAYGNLTYNYREKRLAYFPPGEVKIVLSQEDKRKVLFTKLLRKRDVEVINISSKQVLQDEKKKDTRSITVEIDTTKIWSFSDYIIGAGGQKNKGAKISQAINVLEARQHIGAKQIWVYGYIVGCMKTSHLILSEPFSLSSNIAIAARQNIEDKEECIAVELRKKKLKEAINLMDNPDKLYKKVFIKGDLVEDYYGTIGLKNCSEYHIK